MSHDNDDGSNDVQNVRQERPAKGNEDSITKKGTDKYSENDIVKNHQSADDGEEQKEEALVEILNTIDNSDALKQVLALFKASSRMEYSGMLPPPDIYEKYDAGTRERMCRWNDANTVDESKRQDKLVDNEVKQNERGVFYRLDLSSSLLSRHLLPLS